VNILIADPVGALRAAVESHERYAALTHRSLDCIALHPEHAKQLLALLQPEAKPDEKVSSSA
jgi:hypothetical protein